MKKYLYIICSLFALLAFVGCESNESELDNGVQIPVEQLTLSVDGASTAGDSYGTALTKTIFTGETFDLAAIITPDEATDQSVIWVVDDEDGVVLFNSGDGTVTGMYDGDDNDHIATITAISADNSSASATITVTVTGKVVDVDSVKITADGEDKTSVSTYVGGVVRLAAVINPDDASKKEVEWEVTSGEEYIEWDAVLGKVTAKEMGTATIKVTSVGDTSKTDEIKISIDTQYVTAEEVSFSSTEEDIILFGAEFDVTANIPAVSGADTRYESLKWSVLSGDATISGDDSDESVTIKAGSTTSGVVTLQLTVEVGGGEKLLLEYEFNLVGVKVDVESVTILAGGEAFASDETKYIVLGYNTTLSVVVAGENGTTPTITDYEWTVTNTDNAITFNEETGLVTTNSVGTATLTATSTDVDKKSATIIIEVTNYVTTDDVAINGSDEVFPSVNATYTLSYNDKVYESITWSITGEGATISGATTGESVTITPSSMINNDATLTATVVVGDGSENIVKSIDITVIDFIPVVGDYLFADGSYSAELEADKVAIGIFVEVDKSNSEASIVYIKDAIASYAWADSGYEYTSSNTSGIGTTDAIGGVGNMALVWAANWSNDANSTTDFEHYPAFKAVHAVNEKYYLGTGDEITYNKTDNPYGVWYLPTQTESTAIHTWLSEVGVSTANQMVTDAGGATVFSDINDADGMALWSSSDNSTYNSGAYKSVCVRFYTAIETLYQKKSAAYNVIPMMTYSFLDED